MNSHNNKDERILQKDLQHKIKLANALPISLLFVFVAAVGWMFEKQLETTFFETAAINLSPDSKETSEEEADVEKKTIASETLLASDALYQLLIVENADAAVVLKSDIISHLGADEQLVAKSITVKKLQVNKYYQESHALINCFSQDELDRLELNFSKASVLAKIGNSSAAIASYEHLLSIQKNHQSANINLGFLYLDEGLFVKAEQVFLQGIGSTAGHKKAKNYSGLGEALFQQGRYQEAILSYQKSIEYRPAYALSWRNVAKVARKIGDHQLVLDSYQKAISLEKNNLKMRLEFADYMIGRMDYLKAIEQLKKAKQIDRESFLIRLRLAFSYLQARKPINARKQLALAKKNVQRESEKRKIEAMLNYLTEKYQEVIALLKNNLKKNRDNDFEYYLIAKSYVGLGRNKDGLKYVNKISSESSYFYQGKYLLAEAYVDNDQAVESVKLYRQIIAQINDNSRLLYQAAKAEQQANNYLQAIDLVTQAIKLRPNRRLFLQKADLYWQLGQKEQAIADLIQLLETYPNYLRAMYHLADYSYQTGDIASSIEHFTNLIDQNENYGDAQYQLSVIFFAQRDFVKSEQLLAAYLLRKADSKRSRLLYARTFCETGQFRACKEQLELVLKLAPDYQPALELRKSLSDLTFEGSW